MPLLVGSFFIATAQSFTFGAKAGFLYITEKVKVEDVSDTNGEAGFYIGGVADLEISERFDLTTELTYGYTSDEQFIYIPLMWRYYTGEKFNLQAGPQVSFLLGSTGREFDNFGLDLSFGLGYDIDESFFVEARYSFEVTNRFKGSGDDKRRFRPVSIGLGYRFL